MATRPDKAQLLALVQEIRTAIESDDASKVTTRPALLTNITKLRDAVEAPQDSLLRICSQVSRHLKIGWLVLEMQLLTY